VFNGAVLEGGTLTAGLADGELWTHPVREITPRVTMAAIGEQDLRNKASGLSVVSSQR
jgi:hypothetical protein